MGRRQQPASLPPLKLKSPVNKKLLTDFLEEQNNAVNYG
jgi:hypothetical protein